MRIKRNSLIGLLLALAAVATVTGCGDAEGDSTAAGGRTDSVRASTTVTTGSLSKERFTARANTICKVSQAGIRKRFAVFRRKQHAALSTEQMLADANKSFVLPGIQFQFDYIRALGGPSGDEGQVEEMVGAMQLAIETGERRHLSSGRQLAGLFAAFNRLAHRYGVNHCLVDRTFYGPLWFAE